MTQENSDDGLIRDILARTRRIAVVGASNRRSRPSHGVTGFLISKGYEVYPVNPAYSGETIFQRPFIASLREIPVAIDIVDIVRNSQAAFSVVEEALALTPLPRVIWMQLGVQNEAAAAMAKEKGVTVIMDRCPKIEYARLCA